VLVSLTIMALIAGVAFAGLSVALDSWRKGSQKIEQLDGRFALERLVQRQISLADAQLFRGTDRELQFISSYSLLSGPGQPVWVKYVADAGKFIYAEHLCRNTYPSIRNLRSRKRWAAFRGLVSAISSGIPMGNRRGHGMDPGKGASACKYTFRSTTTR